MNPLWRPEGPLLLTASRRNKGVVETGVQKTLDGQALRLEQESPPIIPAREKRLLEKDWYAHEPSRPKGPFPRAVSLRTRSKACRKDSAEK